LRPAAGAGASYAGRRWALPISLDCLALFYDRHQVSRPPASLDELEAAARRATVDASGRHPGDPGFDPARISRWGFFVRADAYWFLPFLWASGGELMDPHAGRVFIDEPTAVGALRRYRDLIKPHQVAPPRPSPSNDYEEQMRRFAEGELAMMVNGPWATAALLARPGFAPGRLGLAPFPGARSGAPASPLSGHGYVVSSCARAPAAAWKLAEALGGVEAQARFAGANSLPPARASAYARPEARTNPFLAGFRTALEAARPRPQHPAIARNYDDFNPAVQAVLLGDASPEEALAGVARAWRRLLGSGAAKP
jgi:arabinogalactan oligomer/maltooligosaccharide transport system substrate-binding protein